jgi:hypothetical protein
MQNTLYIYENKTTAIFKLTLIWNSASCLIQQIYVELKAHYGKERKQKAHTEMKRTEPCGQPFSQLESNINYKLNFSKY